MQAFTVFNWRKMTSALSLTTLLAVGFFYAQHATAQDLQRGLRNYHEIINGKKKFEQLSPDQQREVLIVHRRIQGSRTTSEENSQCREAKSRAESAASELGDYARRLRNCAEGANFNDDCGSEFRRTRSAHSDYENAISEVNNYCR